MLKPRPSRKGILLALAICVSLCGGAECARSGGVTVITHGFNSNVTDWIIPMAGAVPGYPSFPGTAYSCYQISITRNGAGQYVAAATFLGGVPPLTADSGEILVKLDWSTISSLGGASSTIVAQAATDALLSTTLIPALGGRPLAELPLHLIGHSRGGSVVTEMARLLGAQGLWVDEVTTLDPRPVSQFGDASVTSYANVLFADNFFQTMGDGLIVPNGQPMFGAYNRKLLDLNGGYSSTHSDAHLWYHGTIDLATPASDTQATITNAQRTTWWSAAELAGAATGFRYSLLGGGDRLSNTEPAGVGNGRINDGFNRNWDLGAGMAANRTALSVDSGLWPNAIRFDLAVAGPMPAGAPFVASLYYQSGSTTAGEIVLHVFLDPDFNPYNGNEIAVTQRALPNTGIGSVGFASLALSVDPALVAPGNYGVFAEVSDGTRVRFLYAPQRSIVTPSLQPPAVETDSITRTNGSLHFIVRAFPGQDVTILATTDFAEWTPIQEHVFTGTTWEFIDPDAGQFSRRFYRAVLSP